MLSEPAWRRSRTGFTYFHAIGIGVNFTVLCLMTGANKNKRMKRVSGMVSGRVCFSTFIDYIQLVKQAENTREFTKLTSSTLQHFVAFSFTTCGVSTFHTDRDLFDIYFCSFSAIISVVKGTYGKLYPCHCDALFGISCELHRPADQKREKQSI